MMHQFSFGVLSGSFGLFGAAGVVLGAAVGTPERLGKRQDPDPYVWANGSIDGGWESIAEPNAATHRNFTIGDSGVTFPILQSNDNPDTSRVKRAVIVVHGKDRQCWYYFTGMHNALIEAVNQDLGVAIEEVSVTAPCFMAEVDKAGAVGENDLIFGLTTWASGHYSVGPDFAGEISSYQVLDELVASYMDRDTYPDLNTVVVAGHSLGGQAVQRYATLRSVIENNDRLHYWVANPGSLLWLTEDRPDAELAADCDGYDLFKYGLAGNFPAYGLARANDLGRDGLLERYLNRNIHYAWGLDDDGPGDTRCQAVTQGSSHIERGQNFDAMLRNMTGGLPAGQTIDYVEGASHNDQPMMLSDAGLDKLFVVNYNGTS